MSLPEFLEWMAFDARDPLPDRRQDWHHAADAALQLNLHAKRKGGGAWTADEMRLFRDSWKPPADDAAALAARRAAVAQKVRALAKRRSPA